MLLSDDSGRFFKTEHTLLSFLESTFQNKDTEFLLRLPCLHFASEWELPLEAVPLKLFRQSASIGYGWVWEAVGAEAPDGRGKGIVSAYHGFPTLCRKFLKAIVDQVDTCKVERAVKGGYGWFFFTRNMNT